MQLSLLKITRLIALLFIAAFLRTTAQAICLIARIIEKDGGIPNDQAKNKRHGIYQTTLN